MPPGNSSQANRFRKPKNAKATLRRIMGYFKSYKLELAMVTFFIVISAAANVAGTYMLRPIINDYIMPLVGRQNPDMSGFIRILAIMAAMYTAGAAAIYAYNRLMIRVAAGTLYRMRSEMFAHLQRLPVSFFDKHTHGEIMSRFTNDTDAMRELLSNGVPQLINSTARILGVFAMMLIISPLLTLIALVMLGVMLLTVRLLTKKSGFYFKKRQKSLGEVNGYIEEMIEGQKVVKVFCHEEAVRADFDAINDELSEATASANTWSIILMPIMGNLSHLHYAITAAAGGLMAVSGMLDLGAIASFLQYSRNFSMPITQLSQQFNSAMSALAGAERIFEMLDEAKEADGGDVTLVYADVNEKGEVVESEKRTGAWAWKIPEDGRIRYARLAGDVRFHSVTFSYDGDRNVLHDVSLYARPGEKIAFVGSTGAGKTTITNLINRFYDVQHGEITYDGVPIVRIRKDDLRKSLSMVLQDTHLFTGTVRDNIRYGRLNASDAEVEAAAKLANAHYFISHLPQGYDTVITGDGGNLSQGQRQLLAIARAAVADPPVLILDEATSSIDTRTEALIEKGMDKLMVGRTVFVIAHRLSTVRNSNAIMVLENGEIIERGNHEQLLSQRGKYYQLYMGMFELS